MGNVSSAGSAGLGTFSFGGLSSGINTNQLLDQLIAIERRPITLLQDQQSKLKLQKTTFQTINSNLLKLQTSITALSQKSNFDLFSASVSAASSSDADIVTASASSDASPGTFSVEVISLAQARSMSSSAFGTGTLASQSVSTGNIVINGKAIAITSAMTLNDLKNAINDANVGVSAQVLSVSSTTNKLVITSNTTGSEGFSIADIGTGDLLQDLGITGTATALKRLSGATTVQSDRFNSASSTIDGLLGKTTGVTGTVTIGGQTTANIDFSSDTLTTIASKIDALSSVAAQVQSETATDGTTKYYIEVTGSTDFDDSATNILEALGILVANPKTSAATSRVLTGSVGNTTDGSTPITAATTFVNIFGAGVQNSDTITISGTKHDGTSASGTFTVTDRTTQTVQNLLTQIETTFSLTAGSATVTTDGKIKITDPTAGSSQLAVTLTENNQGGGSLNFGNLTVTTEGTDASTSEIRTGQDANMKVDGALVTRSDNAISDAITGVTLNLNRAKTGTPVTVTVGRDTASIKSKIKTFVDDYNSALAFISNQFRFDEETQTAGPLTGDPTLLSIQSQIRSQISTVVSGLTSSRNSLAVIGIAHDKEGVLKIDDAKLDSALQSNFTDVRDIFIANGTPSVTDLEFISVSDKTKAGTYTINVTAAAEQAFVKSDSAVGTLGSNQTITITDTAANISATVSLSSGDTIDTIVNEINSELTSKKTQKRTSSGPTSPNTLSPSAKLSDSLGNPGGLGAVNGEVITVSGRTHNGTQVSGTLTVTAGTTTVQDLLNKIEDVYNGTVTASIEGGKVAVTDTQSGASLMDISVTSTGSAGGNLDSDGNLDLTTTGRSAIEITASKGTGGDLNKLILTHNTYGSTSSKLSATLSSTADIQFGGGASASDTGVDVAGTIGGETATGSGRVLTGSSGNSNTDGLAIRVLSTSSGTIGTIKTIIGAGEDIKRTLDTFTDSLEGLIASREEGLQNTINDLNDRVDLMEKRVELKRQRLSSQFTNLELIVGSFNSLGTFLTAQLARLPTFT